MNLTKFFNKKNIKRYTKILQKIRACESQKYQSIEKDEIAQEFLSIKNNESIKKSEKIIHAIALANKASQKTLQMSYYDVQIIGALALIDGCMAEMKTGEGKTLTCTAAVAANSIIGNVTHVATANDYLAQRDQTLMKDLYDTLGISSSHNVSSMEREEKRQSYKTDVMYSTAQELGFDFLRDNLVSDYKDKIQPKLHTVKAIIDEADFILIDEARTPLIISGESPLKNLETYFVLRELALKLNEMPEAPEEKYMEAQKYIPGDFWIDGKYKAAHISEEGFEKIEGLLSEAGLLDQKGGSLYHHSNGWLVHEILNALRAEYCYKKEKDYVIIDGTIVIIDQNTGRLSEGRTWSNGLHQAIEAKEGLKINPETMTLGTISVQNYFRNYKNISGMSGTIMTSSLEFHEIYNTTTIQIPTNRKMVRKDHNDKIFITLEAKYKDLIKNISQRHNLGQPILLGTTSVRESEEISNLLKNHNIKHHVLNAKNHHREAQIISQAGKPFAVTVSTSMAGRGTDIILGGNKDEMCKIIKSIKENINERRAYISVIQNQMLEQGIEQGEYQEVEFQNIEFDNIHDHMASIYDTSVIVELLNLGLPNVFKYLNQLEEVADNELKTIEEEHNNWRETVKNLGGLFVIGSSRNESRRVDDQLRGRAGRQGDPGESLYYISLQDDWVSHLGRNPLFQHVIKSLPPEEAIESGLITKAIFKAQANIEGLHYTSRKSTFQYDSVADEGRRQFLSFRDLAISDYNTIKNFGLNTLVEELSHICSEGIFEYVSDEWANLSHSEIIDEILKLGVTEAIKYSRDFSQSPYYIKTKMNRILIKKIEDFSSDEIKYIDNSNWIRITDLAIDKLDKKWAEHLLFVEDARQNVAFSGMAQKNPLQEFKKLCFESFNRTFSEFGLDIVEIMVENKQEEFISEVEIEQPVLA